MACSFPNSGSTISTACYSNLNQFGAQRSTLPWSFNHPIFSPSKQASKEQVSTNPVSYFAKIIINIYFIYIFINFI